MTTDSAGANKKFWTAFLRNYSLEPKANGESENCFINVYPYLYAFSQAYGAVRFKLPHTVLVNNGLPSRCYHSNDIKGIQEVRAELLANPEGLTADLLASVRRASFPTQSSSRFSALWMDQAHKGELASHRAILTAAELRSALNPGQLQSSGIIQVIPAGVAWPRKTLMVTWTPNYLFAKEMLQKTVPRPGAAGGHLEVVVDMQAVRGSGARRRLRGACKELALMLQRISPQGLVVREMRAEFVSDTLGQLWLVTVHSLAVQNLVMARIEKQELRNQQAQLQELTTTVLSQIKGDNSLLTRLPAHLISALSFRTHMKVQQRYDALVEAGLLLQHMLKRRRMVLHRWQAAVVRVVALLALGCLRQGDLNLERLEQLSTGSSPRADADGEAEPRGLLQSSQQGQIQQAIARGLRLIRNQSLRSKALVDVNVTEARNRMRKKLRHNRLPVPAALSKEQLSEVVPAMYIRPPVPTAASAAQIAQQTSLPPLPSPSSSSSQHAAGKPAKTHGGTLPEIKRARFASSSQAGGGRHIHQETKSNVCKRHHKCLGNGLLSAQLQRRRLMGARRQLHEAIRLQDDKVGRLRYWLAALSKQQSRCLQPCPTRAPPLPGLQARSAAAGVAAGQKPTQQEPADNWLECHSPEELAGRLPTPLFPALACTR